MRISVSDENRIKARESDDNALVLRARDSNLVTRTLTGDSEAFEDLVRLQETRDNHISWLRSADESDQIHF